MHPIQTHHTTLIRRVFDVSPRTLRATTKTARARSALLLAFVCWACLGVGTPAQASSESHDSESGHGSGALVLHHPGGDADALILHAEMDLEVQGLLANMTLAQTFRNTSEQWLTGSYLFPLPEDAAVRGMRITIGDRHIVSRIRPRQQARADFEQAVQAGQIASLMEQQRPNLFTMQVANIAPQAEIKVTLDVMLPVRMAGRQMSLVLPTTLTPRYLNADASNAQALQSDFIQPDHKQGPTLAANLTIAPLDDAGAVTSNVTFAQASEKGFRIEAMPMNRDLTITWPAQHDPATRVHAFVSQHGGERYVQLLVSPPEQMDNTTHQPRELIIVLDKSGSMAGVSMRAAIDALDQAINSLTAKDLLNIVAFDDLHYPLFDQSLAASDSVKQSARRFAASLQADGGTEMGSALAFALQRTSNDDSRSEESANRLKQIVFITDGSVGNEAALLRNIRKNLGSSRLFTVGIGSAPNHWFLEKAAEAGRGVTVSIQEEHDVADAISELLNGLRFPVLTDIAVQYPQGRGEMYPQPLPDLYANIPAMWVGKLSDDVDEIVITGMRRNLPFRETITLVGIEDATEETATASQPLSAPSVAMHWARQKISALDDEQRHAADPEMNRQAITQLAMQTGLLTRYTSLIAVEEEPSRPLNETLDAASVANRLPQGNQMTGITLPQGAAGIDTLLWVSLILGMSGLALLTVSRRRC